MTLDTRIAALSALDEKKCREAFEKVDFSTGLGGTGSNCKRPGGYSSDKTQWRYEGYRAALPEALSIIGELKDKLEGNK